MRTGGSRKGREEKRAWKERACGRGEGSGKERRR